MKLCVIGTGYVGLVTGTCFAETGNDVVCMDLDEVKIGALNRGRVPIFEPGLEEMIQRNRRERRLRFTTDLDKAVRASLLVFITVGTPSDAEGATDLGPVLSVARDIGRAMNGYKIIVTKSTVPVGTSDRVRDTVAGETDHDFEVVSNPEFLKEGAAIEDFMKPDRVIVGSDDSEAAEVMKELYAPFTRTGAPIMIMSTRSAEMTKYAANAMLACRISFINEIANLCEHLEADVHWVRQGIGADRRIGRSFLFPGVGYGGSCFPKDIRALIKAGRQSGCSVGLLSAVREVNQQQKEVLVRKILSFYTSELPQLPGDGKPSKRKLVYSDILSLPEEQRSRLALQAGNRWLLSAKPPRKLESALRGKTFAVWGLAFKPQTDDMREAPSRVIIDRLLKAGARIQAYDPEAGKTARGIFADKIEFAGSNYKALEGADALVLVTEWNLFRNPDFLKMKKLLKFPVIFDGRNQYNPEEMRHLGFFYFGIGRP